MTYLNEVRDRMRNLAEKSYGQIEWRGEDLGIAEMPALPDWLLGVAVQREFGGLGEFDPTTSTLNIEPRVRSRVTTLFLSIMAMMLTGSAHLKTGARELSPIEAETHAAVSFHHSTSTAPLLEELSNEQRQDAELFQAMQVVTHWITQVLLQRARELRMEERTQW